MPPAAPQAGQAAPQPIEHDQDAAHAANIAAQLRNARGAAVKEWRNAAAHGAEQLAIETHVRSTEQASAVAGAAVQISNARAVAHGPSDHVSRADTNAAVHEAAAASTILQPHPSGGKRPPAAEPAAGSQVASRVHAADTASKALSPPSSRGARHLGSDAQRRSQRFAPSMGPAAKRSADENVSSSVSSSASDSGSDDAKCKAAPDTFFPQSFSDPPHHDGILSIQSPPFEAVQHSQTADSEVEEPSEGNQYDEAILALAVAHAAETSSPASSSSAAQSEDSCEGESDQSDNGGCEDDDSEDRDSEGKNNEEAEAAGDLQAPSPSGAIATSVSSSSV